LNLSLYRGIWVSGSGGFRGCSIFSGDCHIMILHDVVWLTRSTRETLWFVKIFCGWLLMTFCGWLFQELCGWLLCEIPSWFFMTLCGWLARLERLYDSSRYSVDDSFVWDIITTVHNVLWITFAWDLIMIRQDILWMALDDILWMTLPWVVWLTLPRVVWLNFVWDPLMILHDVVWLTRSTRETLWFVEIFCGWLFGSSLTQKLFTEHVVWINFVWDLIQTLS